MNKTSNIGDRLLEAIRSRGLTQVQFCKQYNQYCLDNQIKSSIAKTTMTGYIRNTHVPPTKKIYIFARILNVSEAWLMGYDVDINGKPLLQKPDLEMTVRSLFDQIQACGNSCVVRGEDRTISSEMLDVIRQMADSLVDLVYLAGKPKESE